MRRSVLRITFFRSPLLVVIALGLLAGACTDEGELGGPTFGGALAARVGSFEYTSADLEEEVEQWASNPTFMAEVLNITDVGRKGQRNAQLVSFVLEHRVLSEQSRQLGRANGFEPAEAEISALLDQVDQAFPDPSTGGPIFQAYDDEFRQRLGADFAYQQNLQTIDPNVAEVPDVVINPRYGSFLDQDRGIGSVLPPPGPQPQPPPSGP